MFCSVLFCFFFFTHRRYLGVLKKSKVSVKKNICNGFGSNLTCLQADFSRGRRVVRSARDMQ